MKTFKYLSMMAFAAIMSFGLTACNNDDDENGDGGRGKTSVTINGTTFSVNYGYWDTYKGKKYTICQFYAYNNKIENWKDPIHHVSVTYSSRYALTGFETGSFDAYIVSVGITTVNESKYVYYYANWGVDGNTGNINISKSGDKYTIEVPSLNYRLNEGEEGKTFPGTAFSFTGTLTKMPQNVDAKQLNPPNHRY